MKFIEKYKIENDELKFTVNNKDTIKLSFVNALRRIILSEIPVYVLDNIDFIENNSSLNNEFLKRRLSLLPVLFKENDEYDDLTLELNYNNSEEYIKTIYMHDFTVVNSNLKINEIIRFPKILFTKLKEGNKIHFKGKMVLGTAKNKGSAYSPVNIVTIRFEKDHKQIKNIIKDIKDPFKKDNFIKYDSNRIYLKNKKDEPEKYNITIEGSGIMNSKNILIKSLEVLYNKINNVSEALQNEDNDYLKLVNQESSLGGIDIIITNEDDTLGNILSSYILEDKEVKFCSYNIPHPLINELKIRLTLNKSKDKKDYIKCILNGCNNIKKIINTFKKEVESFS